MILLSMKLNKLEPLYETSTFMIAEFDFWCIGTLRIFQDTYISYMPMNNIVLYAQLRVECFQIPEWFKPLKETIIDSDVIKILSSIS